VVHVLLRFGGIGFVILLALWLYCLLDVITTDEAVVRNLPKIAWVLIVLLLLEVGAVLWLIAGRPRRQAAPDLPYKGNRGRPSRTGPSTRAVRDTPPPDDDPEFLAKLNRRQQEEDRRMLDRWEAELRRREEELRRREGGGREQDKDGNPGPDDPLL
jgi:hypothetical protein